ncbi:hypothetical protein JAAARDRAFT_31962 [Jaapia argillacea MUCL 33604]|uniref:NADP-dependent oxidoreductase domain-containing protein n=1 Tax=Jaapia argillacea MUCL 33604 TaxID=933084 RepID=A0A067Q4A8_9AGAM|nr:hypothetical protein JAAARDRAFT_31962 [Jaapia argillacea MUCL 33604]
MATLTFPLNDGTRIPALAFGTGTALYQKDAQHAVEVAISSGFIHLDGAQVYGNEESLGAAIAASGKPRDSLYIVTKLGKLPQGQTVVESLKESLKKLNLDYVDLFLIHMPVHHEGKLKEVWKGVEETKTQGLAKSIGVSNFRVKDLEEILSVASIIPAVNQIEFHPYLLKWAEPIVEFGKKHGIVTSSYGGLTPIIRHQGGPLDPIVASIRERLEKSRGKPVTESQVYVKWILQKGVVAITTSSNEGRVKQYLETSEVPDLTPEEIASIDNAGKQIHKRFFNAWLEH